MPADLSRRTLLGTTGAVAATAAAVDLSAGHGDAAADAADAPHRIQVLNHDLTDIKHVVICMQENRAFDHYYGSMKGVRGFGDRATSPQQDGSAIWKQPIAQPGMTRLTHYPWSLSSNVSYISTDIPPSAEAGAQNAQGTDHGWDSQHLAWYGGWMNGWFWAKGGPETLGYMTRNDMPWQYALADAYTIGDAYHCSIQSATGPNRTYLWSGTVNASQDHNGSTYVAYSGGDESGLTWETYAEDLQAAGVTWQVYNCQDNYGDNGLQYFARFAKNSGDFSNPNNDPLWNQAIKPVSTDTGQTMSNADDLVAALRQDVIDGTLPQVSWVVTNQTFSEHPDGAAVNGAYYLNGVLEALSANMETFHSTLVIVNYDENDGQFDHVPPPVAPADQNHDEWYTETSGTAHDAGLTMPVPIGLGFRVPLVLISPWTRGGHVFSEVADHTSVIQFLEKWTAANGTPATSKNISAWRRAVCSDLTGALDMQNPVWGLPDLGVPVPTPIADPSAGAYQPTPIVNQMPTQEAGTKPARALPLQPNLAAAVTGTSATLVLSNAATFATKSSHFSVYDVVNGATDLSAYPTGFPGQYTVAPNTTQSAVIPVGTSYDLTVMGPNRFLRHLTGSGAGAAAAVEVNATYGLVGSGKTPQITFTVTNAGSAAATVTLADSYYLNASKSLTVAPSASATWVVDLSSTSGWYDVAATVAADSTWTRRLTGHVENGAPSITG